MSTRLVQERLSSTVLERTLGMPEEGPKCIPIKLDFTSETLYTLDYQNMQARNYISCVQAVWVDNRLGTSADFIIRIPSVQQEIHVPPTVQGYFAVVCPNPIKMEFESTSGAILQVILLNYPVIT